MQIVALLGRQPALGIAELESRFGGNALVPLRFGSAIGLDVPAKDFSIDEFGGTIKAARLLTQIPSTNWHDIAAYLVKTVPEHLKYLPEDGKLKLGLSAYGLKVHTSDLTRTGLELKKVIKRTGRSVRIVPNKTLELSTATVQHNQLLGDLGWELVLISNGHQTVLAQTFGLQDIEAYAARDQVRPMRDARVGMLPPKLAQIIINLAVPGSARAAHNTILDPFCGTGVLLQEAILLGYDAVGTDLEQRMVDYSIANLNWLTQKWHRQENFHVSPGDATDMVWQQDYTAIASETYLGRPLSSLPDRHELDSIVNTGDKIHSAFLRNVAAQTKSGLRLCLAIPAWRTAPDDFRLLPFQQQLNKFGFKRVDFMHVNAGDLIYARPDQLVGRQLLTMERV